MSHIAVGGGPVNGAVVVPNKQADKDAGANWYLRTDFYLIGFSEPLPPTPLLSVPALMLLLLCRLFPGSLVVSFLGISFFA